MKKLYIFLIFFIVHISANSINLTVSSAVSAKMPIALVIENNPTSHELAKTIKKDLNFTDQFAPKTYTTAATTKKDLARTTKALAGQGTPLALHVTVEKENIIKWRLYDTMQGTMIQGKKYTPHGNVARVWAHAIADDVVQTLTGNTGFFSSRIVFCKEHKVDENKNIKHLYIADYDGSHQECLVNDSNTTAPRWNRDAHHPRISYSEHTDTNVQLLLIDLHKNKTVASNLDGITMLVDFSPDGEKSIFCASMGKGNCQLYCQTKDSLRPLTNNNGNNFSPSFVDNNRICFGSDAQTHSPQIYIGDLQTGHIHRITKGGYCTSPSYSSKTNTIAYHMKVNNVMQIVLYDCAAKTHTQVTHGPENKHGVSWSPDGTHLLFATEHVGKSQITALNLSTKKIQYVTSAQENCSYSHWSPQYKIFPTIL